jgi:small subunit ribosomal protein S6
VREYELMCVLNPDLDEAGVEAQNERLKTLIAGRGGEVISIEPWGRRRLAYPIKNFRDGIYTITRFKLAPEETDAIERSLKLTESVIRHLVVRPDAN